MHKTVLSAVVAVVLLVCATPLLAMGGGYGGGGYGGGGFSAPRPAFDDYSTAQRLIKHQEYAQAIPHLEAALEKHPHDADILNYLGYAHRMVGMGYADAARDGEFKMSLDFYQRALALDPNHRGVHEYLGELYLQMHDVESAKHEMNLLVILCPSGCEERDMLNRALIAYVPAAMPAAAAPSSAAPTTTQ